MGGSLRDLIVNDLNARLHLLQRQSLGPIPVKLILPDVENGDYLILELANGNRCYAEVLEEADKVVICFENTGLELVIAKSDIWGKPH